VNTLADRLVKVLLIEDNDADARFISEMFKDIKTTKYEVSWAKRLDEGLKLLDDDSFDVLLLDLSLPDSIGLETFERAHEYEPELPIVILSGLDDEEVAVRAVREGAQDYLMKGEVSARLLSRAISYAIERHNAEKELIESRNDLISLINNYTTELKERGVKEAEDMHKSLETKIANFEELKSSNIDVKAAKDGAGNIQLFNERVPKSLWLQVAGDFKTPEKKLSVDENNIKLESAEANDLENLVEFIKELGERGYFAEEHYVVDLGMGSSFQ
jgi:DNA-binding response OmpR family regulator